MAELPTDLQRLVAEARMAHDPDDAAQQRVRAALAATLTTGVAAGATVTTLKAGSAASTSAVGAGAASATKTALLVKLAAAKTALLTGASVVVVGGGVWVASQGELSDSTPREAAKPGVAAMEHAAARETNAAGPAQPTVQFEPPEPPAAPKAQATGPLGLPDAVTQSAPAVPVVQPAPSRPRRASRDHASSARAGQRKVGIAKVTPATTVGTASVPSAGHEPVSAQLPEPVAAPAVRPPVVSLGGELNLIRRATSAVSAGHYAAALDALSEHAARYPVGSLVEERLGLRAVSLCKLQRADAATAAQSFADNHPDSPLLARVRAACEDLP